MKKLFLIVTIAATAIASSAQDSTSSRREDKGDRKDARRQKINSLIRQSEEGVLVYHKQSIFGIQGRTNGYGLFYELGKMKSNRKTNIYRIDFTETKNAKEEKQTNGGSSFGNTLIYGKINYFYPLTIGFGQQLTLGQKGNKNGVAVSLLYNGGVALGLLRPYYVDVLDNTVQEEKTIKYSKADSVLFLNGPFYGGAGFSKGWNEIKIKPGAFAKAAMRFDYGRFNEVVSGLEIGMSVEAYAEEIEILFGQKKRLFFQGYVALLFGRRKYILKCILKALKRNHFNIFADLKLFYFALMAVFLPND